ncbi:MAG: succinylglutamate desuccinylase/aspartoacylase family protein [Candidatus Bathyarchaeota archaeon]|nr:succinylglutamate desuccinylase/aspartoacylase family protein [Candidatus Bathyarchaeota archaeon]
MIRGKRGGAAMISLGGVKASPGEKSTGFIDVGDDRYKIPVAVINGVLLGKTLGLFGGTHGTEFASVEAVTRVIRSLDPSVMRGAVLATPLLNRAQFEKRTQYTSPVDKLNLNGVFPGDASGSLTQRVANAAFEGIVSKCDALVDCHGGDIDEDIRGFVVAAEGKDAAVNAEALALASCFPCDLTHVFPASGGMSLGAQGIYGIPCVMPEAGTPHPVREEAVRFHHEGVTNVLRYMHILGGEPKRRAPRVSRRRLRVLASVSGAWHPSVELDDEVKKGAELGRVTDVFGDVVQVAKAPEGGVVGMTRCFYSVNKGETLAVVSAFD